MGKIRHLLPTVLQSHKGINSEKKYGRQKKGIHLFSKYYFSLTMYYQMCSSLKSYKAKYKKFLALRKGIGCNEK